MPIRQVTGPDQDLQAQLAGLGLKTLQQQGMVEAVRAADEVSGRILSKLQGCDEATKVRAGEDLKTIFLTASGARYAGSDEDKVRESAPHRLTESSKAVWEYFNATADKTPAERAESLHRLAHVMDYSVKNYLDYIHQPFQSPLFHSITRSPYILSAVRHLPDAINLIYAKGEPVKDALDSFVRFKLMSANSSDDEITSRTLWFTVMDAARRFRGRPPIPRYQPLNIMANTPVEFEFGPAGSNEALHLLDIQQAKALAREGHIPTLIRDILDNTFGLPPGVLPANARTLNVGFGTVADMQTLKEAGFGEVRGLDADETLVAIARDSGFDAMQGDALRLPYAEGSFDIIYCRNLFDRGVSRVYLEECRRVGREGARILLSTTNDINPDFRSYCEDVGFRVIYPRDEDMQTRKADLCILALENHKLPIISP